MQVKLARLGRAVVPGVIGTAIYAGIVAFANTILKQDLPLLAWVAFAIMGLTMLGALAIQRQERRRLEDELLKWEGVEKYTGLSEFEPELNSSDEHPRAQLDKIRFSLDFMGNGGSKWSREEEKMRAMLVQVGNSGKKARMLLLHPSSKVCREASEQRHGNPTVLPMKIVDSLRVLDRLRGEFKHLKIRTYEHTPYFRLVFVDERTVIVGHYKQYREDSDNTPLLVWEAECDWSFYYAFSKYFESEWGTGKDISTKEVNELAARFENGNG